MKEVSHSQVKSDVILDVHIHVLRPEAIRQSIIATYIPGGCEIADIAESKKEAKSTVPSVLGLERVLKYNFQYTAENLHTYLLTRAPTLRLEIAIQSVIGFIKIRTRALFECLRRWPQGCSNPCTPFQMYRFDEMETNQWDYIQR